MASGDRCARELTFSQHAATGAEPAVPIVLVHGFPLDRRVWQPVARALAARHRVICPDLRGFGEARASEPFTMDDLADDLRALLERLDALPCVLVGLSMGGYASLAFAARHGDALAGLGLVDTRPGADTPEGRGKRDEMIALVRDKGTAAVAEQMYPNMLARATYHERPEVADELMAIMLDCPAMTIEHACAAMRDRPDYTPLLTGLAVPAAVVVGEDDRITPPDLARQMADALPDAALTVVPGAGHMAPLERPGEVAEALLALRRRVPG